MTSPGTGGSAPRGLSRRIFVGIGVAILVPLAGGMGWALRFTRRETGLAARLERLRAAVMERRFRDVPLAMAIPQYYHYLQIAPGSVEQFVTEYQAHRARLGAAVSSLDGIHRFLLSTDFFQQGAEERRPVRFVTLYAPMVHPCYRPFVEGR